MADVLHRQRVLVPAMRRRWRIYGISFPILLRVDDVFLSGAVGGIVESSGELFRRWSSARSRCCRGAAGGFRRLAALWQNHLNYSGSSAQGVTIKATLAQTHFKRNNSWSVG